MPFAKRCLEEDGSDGDRVELLCGKATEPALSVICVQPPCARRLSITPAVPGGESTPIKRDGSRHDRESGSRSNEPVRFLPCLNRSLRDPTGTSPPLLSVPLGARYGATAPHLEARTRFVDLTAIDFPSHSLRASVRLHAPTGAVQRWDGSSAGWTLPDMCFKTCNVERIQDCASPKYELGLCPSLAPVVCRGLADAGPKVDCRRDSNRT